MFAPAPMHAAPSLTQQPEANPAAASAVEAAPPAAAPAAGQSSAAAPNTAQPIAASARAGIDVPTAPGAPSVGHDRGSCRPAFFAAASQGGQGAGTGCAGQAHSSWEHVWCLEEGRTCGNAGHAIQRTEGGQHCGQGERARQLSWSRKRQLLTAPLQENKFIPIVYYVT